MSTSSMPPEAKAAAEAAAANEIAAAGARDAQAARQPDLQPDPATASAVPATDLPAPDLPAPAAPTATWRLWVKTARPFSLPAAVVPMLAGGALSFYIGRFSWLLFVEVILASLLIQAATNFFNEYYDFRRGLDTKDSLGIAGVLVHGQLSPQAVLSGGLVLFAIAGLIGLHVGLQAGWGVFLVGLICMLSAYLYTGGPWPLAYTPFGELQVFLFMGVIMVGIGIYVHTGDLVSIAPQAALVALPVSCIVAAILLANNIRDRQEDGEFGRRTIAVLHGQEKAVALYRVLLTVAFVSPFAGAIFGILPWTTLLSWLSLGTARRASTILRTQTTHRALQPAVPLTAKLHLQFGVLLSLGLVLGTWL